MQFMNNLVNWIMNKSIKIIKKMNNYKRKLMIWENNSKWKLK